MKEAPSAAGRLEIRQESWIHSPCSFCHGTPCCKNLPLTSFRIESRYHFIQLCLLSCYKNVRICLKKGGDWSVYYQQPCSFLQSRNGKCSIHGLPAQSMICKDYDARKCWYRGSFAGTENDTMIQFSTGRLVWFGNQYGFFSSGISGSAIDWKTLCEEIKGIPCGANSFRRTRKAEPPGPLLNFKDADAGKYLFFPLQQRPERSHQFELFKFRLSFPGMSLAITDNCRCYMLQTPIDMKKLGQLRREFFPGLLPAGNPFSFTEINRKAAFRSGMGEAFVIAGLAHIAGIEKLAGITASANATEIPSAREIFKIVNAAGVSKPDRIA